VSLKNGSIVAGKKAAAHVHWNNVLLEKYLLKFNGKAKGHYCIS
jgi:hypothetical protein